MKKWSIWVLVLLLLVTVPVRANGAQSTDSPPLLQERGQWTPEGIAPTVPDEEEGVPAENAKQIVLIAAGLLLVASGTLTVFAVRAVKKRNLQALSGEIPVWTENNGEKPENT